MAVFVENIPSHGVFQDQHGVQHKTGAYFIQLDVFILFVLHTPEYLVVAEPNAVVNISELEDMVNKGLTLGMVLRNIEGGNQLRLYHL